MFGEDYIEKHIKEITADLAKEFNPMTAEEKQAEFEKWVQEGEIIDAEFEEIN